MARESYQTGEGNTVPTAYPSSDIETSLPPVSAADAAAAAEEYPQGLPSFIPVLCRVSDEPDRRILLSRCDEREAAFIAMRPPPLGSTVHLKREIDDDVKTVQGLVVEIRYNPSDAKRCGFSVVLLDGDMRASLMPRCATETKRGAGGFERRRHPRIGIRMNGTVKIPGINMDVTISNISMSGALAKSVEGAFPSVLDIGALLHLVILADPGQPLLTLKAEIARLIGIGSPSSAGLRVIDLANHDSEILEQLMLGQISAPEPDRFSPVPITEHR
jgi:hypothetical protein